MSKELWEVNDIIMDIIVHSGEAKSYAMEAMQRAKLYDIKTARVLIEKSIVKLERAHVLQSTLIQEESSKGKIELSILLIHAQDQLMNSMLLKDLANEFIDLYEKLKENNIT